MSEDQSRTGRVTVEEAARLLGIEKGSVKKRVQRGKLASERSSNGTLYVYVDTSETVQDSSQGQSETTPPSNEALIDAKDETIRILQEQLEAERRAHSEARRLLAGLVQRVPELEPATDPPEQPEPKDTGAEAGGEGASSTQPHPARKQAQRAILGLVNLGGEECLGGEWWKTILTGQSNN